MRLALCCFKVSDNLWYDKCIQGEEIKGTRDRGYSEFAVSVRVNKYWKNNEASDDVLLLQPIKEYFYVAFTHNAGYIVTTQQISIE